MILNILAVLIILHTGCSQFQDRTLIKLFENALDKNITSQKCANSIYILIKSLRDSNSEDLWAWKMLHASARPPESLFSYNVEELGNFDECIQVDSKNDKILGKYCLGDVYLNYTVALKEYKFSEDDVHLERAITKINGKSQVLRHSSWAFCIPSNCTDKDSLQLMKSFQIKGIEVSGTSCTTIYDAYPKLSKDALIGLTIFGIIIFTTICSTIVDMSFHGNKKGTKYRILTSFSLYTNGKKMIQTSKYSTNLSCLDGLRVISMVWILILHQYGFVTNPSFNLKDLVKMKESIISVLFDGGNLACDTFFIISGTLITYLYFKKDHLEDINIVNILKSYLHRYVRLVAALAGIVLFSATLLKYIGSGPQWKNSMNTHLGHCEEKWWSTLMLIQNEISLDNVCLITTWYIDVDFQLFLFSPLVLFIFKKNTIVAIILISITGLTSVVLVFLKTLTSEHGDLTGYYQIIHFRGTPDDIYLYYKTENRITPWLMGTILGYYLTRKCSVAFHIPKKISLSLWVLSLIVMIYCVFGEHESLVSTTNTRIHNALFISLHRPLFSLAVGWIIWACSNNHGGIVNNFLSLPVFHFLNKFTYCMYLTHYSVMHCIRAATRTPFYLNVLNFVTMFWGMYIITFAVSIICILIFEMPMVNLENLVFRSKKNKQKTTILKKEISLDIINENPSCILATITT